MGVKTRHKNHQFVLLKILKPKKFYTKNHEMHNYYGNYKKSTEILRKKNLIKFVEQKNKNLGNYFFL